MSADVVTGVRMILRPLKEGRCFLGEDGNALFV